MNDLFSLAGKNILITGSAQGIGFLLATGGFALFGSFGTVGKNNRREKNIYRRSAIPVSYTHLHATPFIYMHSDVPRCYWFVALPIP